jgi:hypothetical protein
MFFLRVGGTSRTPALPYRPTELIIVKFFCAERADGPLQPIVFLPFGTRLRRPLFGVYPQLSRKQEALYG